MPMVEELERLRKEVEEINRQATALCDGLSEADLAWRPQPGRWSIAENLIHLRTVAEVFMPAVDAAIAGARAKNLCREGPFPLRLMGRLYCWYVEPPPKFRLPAPKILHPLLTGPATNALPLFLDSQKRWVESIEAANGLDLNRVRITSPLAKFVRMDLLTIFHVGTGHARRHLWQARQVRERLPAK